MPPSTKPIVTKIPNELKDLAAFMEKRGFTLAIPFDDIRAPGYIGGFNDKGQEIIIDDGKCLKDFTTKKPGGTILGNYKKAAKFSLKVFLNIFSDLFGLDFDFLRVKNVSISFPQNIVPTEYITVMDIEEDWDKIPAACKHQLTNPNNFLILQVLRTDAIAYSYETKTKLDANAKLDLEKKLSVIAKAGKYQAQIAYESETAFTIQVKDKPLSIGYKTARLGLQELSPAEMVSLRGTVSTGRS